MTERLPPSIAVESADLVVSEYGASLWADPDLGSSSRGLCCMDITILTAALLMLAIGLLGAGELNAE